MVVFPYRVAARNGLACDREYRRKARAALLPREQGIRDLDHSAGSRCLARPEADNCFAGKRNFTHPD